MDEKQAKTVIDSLSQDALAAINMLTMGDMQSTLSFAMVESRPTKRMQTALNECVAANVLSVEKDKSGRVTYRPTFPLADFRQKTTKAAMASVGFILYEKIVK